MTTTSNTPTPAPATLSDRRLATLADLAAHVANNNGWDITADEAARLWTDATETIAWALLDLTSDTTDRAPNMDAINAARTTAAAIVAIATNPS